MTPRKIKKLAVSYIAEQLKKNPDWFDCLSDLWIYDADEWLLEILQNKGMKIFTNNINDFEYTAEVDEIVHKFRGFVIKEKDRKYDEMYGERDAKNCLHRIGNDVNTLKDNFENIKYHFKKYSAVNEMILVDFETLLEHLRFLENIENGKIETLKLKKS